jgi:CO dehydrogenase/acetyl-CoA synthase gamma subunit (corrinoid Fe-S protein)
VTPADLYLESIDFRRYFERADCLRCGYASCAAFVDAVKEGLVKSEDCPLISRNKAHALEVINRIEELWPDVPLLTHPRPGFAGLVELNNPTSDSLVLVSGNNEYTEQVLMTVLGTTICPFFVLFADTDGNTVDMAMIYRTLTAERILDSIRQSGLEERTAGRLLMIPGLAASLEKDIGRLTGWSVRVGPLCAAELPLTLSEIWIPSDAIQHP